MRALVTDGVTMGHPCCGHHECKIPLANNRHRYCPEHWNQEKLCSVRGCNENAEAGYKSCGDPVHRQKERDYYEEGTAIGQLLRRARRAGIYQPDDSVPLISTSTRVEFSGSLESGVLQPVDSPAQGVEPSAYQSDNEIEQEELESSNQPPAQPLSIPDPDVDKAPSGNRKLMTQFGRRRTHNEQLCVCPCGIIIGRETFYGSEGVRNVVVSSFGLGCA
jgi:hypothetical protein